MLYNRGTEEILSTTKTERSKRMENKIHKMFSVASKLHYRIQSVCHRGGIDTLPQIIEDLDTIYSLTKELGQTNDIVCEHYHKISMALYNYRSGYTASNPSSLKGWVLGAFVGLMVWLSSRMGYTPCKNIINNPTTMFFVEDSTNKIVGEV
jgi:hypothetical protein